MHFFLNIIALLLTLSPLSIFAADNTPSYIIDFQKVFSSSPIIYSLLTVLSICSFTVWIYSLVILQKSALPSKQEAINVENLLQMKKFEEALGLCLKKPSILSTLVATGIQKRNLGPQIMFDAIKSEGKRVSTPLWQKLSLLNEIAVIAPMIGLLGTVIGMFYAFYDVNRSVESINTLFDGLGVAVGTTVFGLIVAILAMLFSTTLKFRLIKNMTEVETKSMQFCTLLIPDAR